ncbi:hypothetical protein BJV74DRAFT_815652 [Russula compacta]|nr:hypothetical protein BJV74DRAFT_815652 [Russula compacta]
MIAPQDSPSLRKDDDPAQQYAFSAPLHSSGPAPPPYTNYPTTSQYLVAPATLEPRGEPAGKRFIKAFLVAVFIWFVTGMSISVEVHRSIRSDGNVDDCAPWARVSGQEHPRLPLFGSGAWSQARLNLSAGADALYLVARGALASGNLYVSESHEGSDVSVRVFVHHRDAESLSRASVCRLRRDGGQMGVGIFTPLNRYMLWPTRGRDLRFVVEVGLPLSRGSVRYIPTFHADLPMFALAVDDLSAFRFGDVALQSSNRPIKVEGVVANSLRIHSTNGGISGNINTTNSLTLVTTNSPISVRVGAENGESEKATEVLIQTTNALIEADISLKSNSSLGTGGMFGVHTHTTNAPINIVYHDSPVDSILNFDAHSTNAPVHATLHRAFEGAFSLQTTNSEVVLDPSHNVEDPSGRGRRRVFSARSVSRQVVYGEIEWLPSRSDSRAGSVDITTTNDLLKLTI